MRQGALLPVLQGIIERSYRMPRVVEDAAHYLIGDGGLRALYGTAAAMAGEPEAAREPGARLLVRSADGRLRAALYYPDAMVRHLERHDPRAGIDDRNIDAFAVLVEELDHLLTLASRAASGRTTTLFELELHADVTKYLLVMHLLGRLLRRPRVSEFHRIWTRHHLFGKYEDGGGEEGRRYREAARLAGRYVAWLDRLAAPERRSELVAFHLRPQGEQVRRIESLT